MIESKGILMKTKKYDNIYFSENMDSRKAVYAEKGILILCAITFVVTLLVYLIFQIVGYKGQSYWGNMSNMLGAIVCLSLPLILRRFKLYVNSYFAIFWSLFLVLSYYLGINFAVYKMGPFYDKFVHMLCGVLAGLLGVTILQFDSKFKNKIGIFFSTVAFACMVGLIWEIGEFTYDAIMGTNTQRFMNQATGEPFVGRPALYDIMFDLIADLAGGVILAIIFVLIKPKYVKRLAIIPKSKFEEFNSSEDETKIDTHIDDNSELQNNKENESNE